MKDCLIMIAAREGHLKIFDPTILSTIVDHYKVLIASDVMKGNIDPINEDCYDEIHFVKSKKMGSFAVSYDEQSMIDLIKPYCEKFSPDKVTIFACDEFNLSLIARVTTLLAANGYHSDKSDFFRDKALMKSYLEKNSTVRVPKHILLQPNPGYEVLEEELGLPFVVKPLAEGGAMGISFIHNKKNWDDLCREYDGHFNGYEAETFLSGQLFHVDAVRYQGKVVAKVICEYLHPVGNFIDAKPVGSIPITEKHSAYKAIDQLNEDTLDAFGEDGCFHMECFLEEGKEPVFLEIGWRQAGEPCDDNFRQIYQGYSQTLFYVMACIAYPLPEPDFTLFKTIHFQLAKQKGIFKGLKFPKIQSRIAVSLLIEVGEEVLATPKMYNDISAKFTVKNASNEALYEDFLTLRKASFYR